MVPINVEFAGVSKHEDRFVQAAATYFHLDSASDVANIEHYRSSLAEQSSSNKNDDHIASGQHYRELPYGTPVIGADSRWMRREHGEVETPMTTEPRDHPYNTSVSWSISQCHDSVYLRRSHSRGGNWKSRNPTVSYHGNSAS